MNLNYRAHARALTVPVAFRPGSCVSDTTPAALRIQDALDLRHLASLFLAQRLQKLCHRDVPQRSMQRLQLAAGMEPAKGYTSSMGAPASSITRRQLGARKSDMMHSASMSTGRWLPGVRYVYTFKPASIAAATIP